MCCAVLCRAVLLCALLRSNYAYSLGSISLLFSAIVLCCAHSTTLLLNTVLALYGFGWWLVGAITITRRVPSWGEGGKRVPMFLWVESID